MKIDVTDLLKSVGAELRVDRSEKLAISDENFSLTSPVTVKLKLVNTGRTVLVTGTLKADAKLCCCRCLKEYEQPLTMKVEEEYVRHNAEPCEAEDETCDKEIELKDKDFVFEISEDNKIDLDEAIRQNIIVSLPIKPLCSKTCKLPEVGEKKGKKIDPRLKKLAELKIAGGN